MADGAEYAIERACYSSHLGCFPKRFEHGLRPWIKCTHPPSQGGSGELSACCHRGSTLPHRNWDSCPACYAGCGAYNSLRECVSKNEKLASGPVRYGFSVEHYNLGR